MLCSPRGPRLELPCREHPLTRVPSTRFLSSREDMAPRAGGAGRGLPLRVAPEFAQLKPLPQGPAPPGHQPPVVGSAGIKTHLRSSPNHSAGTSHPGSPVCCPKAPTALHPLNLPSRGLCLLFLSHCSGQELVAPEMLFLTNSGSGPATAHHAARSLPGLRFCVAGRSFCSDVLQLVPVWSSSAETRLCILSSKRRKGSCSLVLCQLVGIEGDLVHHTGDTLDHLVKMVSTRFLPSKPTVWIL